MAALPLPVQRGAILVASTTMQICLGTVYAWSYFQTLLVRELGWSFTDTAWAFSITIFTLGIAAAVGGALLPKLGPRKLALAGAVMFSAGYLIGSFALQVDNLLVFFIGYGVIGGLGIGFGYVTPVATTAKWFPDHKGLATGIVVMGFGVGAFLLSKVLAPLLVVRTDGDLAMVFLSLGVLFAAVLIPSAAILVDPPESDAPGQTSPATEALGRASVSECLRSPEFAFMWLVFFFNIAAGISVISFQSVLLQDVWGLADSTLEPEVLAEYGATLIAVSSLCNGVGRLGWGYLSDRIGRVRIFRVLLASQMVVFGVLMTETNPWVFSALVCYVLLCFGGGFATMPSFVMDVFGSRRMSVIYGALLTAWAAAGVFGPLYVGYIKDRHPDRAVIYCFLVGVFLLSLGFVFTYLLNDERIRLGKPTLAETLAQLGIHLPRRPLHENLTPRAFPAGK